MKNGNKRATIQYRIAADYCHSDHHWASFAIHGKLYEYTDISFVNRIWMQFLLLSGKLGVSLFVLISGYFLIEMPRLKVEKLVKLWLQIFTYSTLAYLVYTVILVSVTAENPFRISELLKNCFGISELVVCQHLLCPFSVFTFFKQISDISEQKPVSEAAGYGIGVLVHYSDFVWENI